MSTVIIGSVADFWSRKPISEEERVRLMRRLKEYVNVSYDSEAKIAWLADKVKPTFQSLLKVRDFLERRIEKQPGIAPVGYSPPQ